MKELLVINPNTSAQISAMLQGHVQAAVGPDVRVCTVTARFGAAYIACEASYAVAGHAVLDAWAAALAGGRRAPDAVLVGCFGDPGLLALRECSPVHVTGLAEGAFTLAARHGRFAIVTGGERWRPMLQRLAQALGYEQHLAGIHLVAPTGMQLAADPAAARRVLAQACRDAARHSSAQAVILGGAALAGMAAAIQPDVDVPVIDSVTAGAHWALHGGATTPGGAGGDAGVAWSRVSPELAAMGRAAA